MKYYKVTISELYPVKVKDSYSRYSAYEIYCQEVEDLDVKKIIEEVNKLNTYQNPKYKDAEVVILNDFSKGAPLRHGYNSLTKKRKTK